VSTARDWSSTLAAMSWSARRWAGIRALSFAQHVFLVALMAVDAAGVVLCALHRGLGIGLVGLGVILTGPFLLLMQPTKLPASGVSAGCPFVLASRLG
jgi:hypothetical protein